MGACFCLGAPPSVRGAYRQRLVPTWVPGSRLANCVGACVPGAADDRLWPRALSAEHVFTDRTGCLMPTRRGRRCSSWNGWQGMWRTFLPEAKSKLQCYRTQSHFSTDMCSSEHQVRPSWSFDRYFSRVFRLNYCGLGTAWPHLLGLWSRPLQTQVKPLKNDYNGNKLKSVKVVWSQHFRNPGSVMSCDVQVQCVGRSH